MTRLVLSLLALGLCAACVPVDMHYRAGATISQLQRNETACEVSALRDAPVANQIRREPGYFAPGQRVCDANGVCTTKPGRWIPGEIITVDVNRDLRLRLYGQCMEDRGFAATRLPACPASIARAAPRRPLQVLPRLTAKSCVIRLRGGGLQIVERG